MPADVPNNARIYDCLLGGAHNLQVDRDRAAELVAAFPDLAAAAWANRAFLRHAVDGALDRGITRFLDLGCGIPAAGAVHEVARARSSQVRVAYVDDEPVVVALATEVLAGSDTVSITAADLFDPEAVLAAPPVADLLDAGQPVALLALASLHFEPDDDRLAAVLLAYRSRLAPGSLLALTHNSTDYPGRPELADARDTITRMSTDMSNPAHDRSRERLLAVTAAAGFAVAEGPVDVGRWAVAERGGEPLGMYALISEPL